MKLEHKIGIAITCTFLCLTGAVIGLKMQEQTTPESTPVAESNESEDLTSSNGDLASLDPWSEGKLNHDQKDPPDDLTYPPKPTKGLHSDKPLSPSKPPAPVPYKLGKEPSDASHTVVTHTTPPAPAAEEKPESLPENKAKPEKPKQTPEPGSAMEDPSTFTIRKPTSLDFGDSKNSGPGSNKTESPPLQPSTDGKDEWSLSPNRSEEKKDEPKLPSSSENSEPAASSKKPSTQTGVKDPATLAVSPTTPPSPVKAPKPASLVSGGPLAPSSSSADGAGMKPSSAGQTSPQPKPMISMPSYLTDESANSKKSPDFTVKAKPAPTPPAEIGKSGEMPAPPTPPAAPTASAPTASPPTPVPAPTPAPDTTPPSPPKPPADGSTYIQDAPPSAPPGGGPSSASAPSPLGAMPKPVPLPTTRPAAVPLASGPDQRAASARTSAPPRSTNTGSNVKVFDEVEYVCKPGDTFQSISKKFLLSPNYAKALQRHNQNHARASSRLAQTGKLTPGEKIYIPQAYILEERYADVIPKPASGSPSPANPPSAVVPAAATSNPPPPPHP